MKEHFKDFFLEVSKDLYKRGSFWTPTLSTNTRSGHPASRTIVLREVIKNFQDSKVSLEFHTDIRSSKWDQLQRSDKSSLHFYCSKRKWQMRITGRGVPVSDHETLLGVWNNISPSSKEIYSLNNSPGSAQSDHEMAMTFHKDGMSEGFRNFGIIRFECAYMDSLRLLSHSGQKLYHERLSWCLKSNKFEILVP